MLTLLLISPVESAVKKKKKTYRIKDKISLITHPLMKNASLSGDMVTFTWNEPHHDFFYFLEIYRKGGKKPISTMKVSGEVKRVRFRKKEKLPLYWRVCAKSQYGNKTSNKKMLLVPLKY